MVFPFHTDGQPADHGKGLCFMVCVASKSDTFILMLQTLLPGPQDSQLQSKMPYLEDRTDAGPCWTKTLSLIGPRALLAQSFKAVAEPSH